MTFRDEGFESSTLNEQTRTAFRKPVTLPIEIARHLREAIIRGEMRPGERLNELKLTQRLKLSRAPVREALRILQAEGLVELKPRQGAFVRTLSVDGLWEIFETRLMFESYAISKGETTLTDTRLEAMSEALAEAKAALLADDYEPWHRASLRFHDELVGLAGNDFLRGLYDLVKTSVRHYQVMLVRIEGQPARSQADHESILRALIKRDFSTALDELRTHFKDLERVLLANIK